MTRLQQLFYILIFSIVTNTFAHSQIELQFEWFDLSAYKIKEINCLTVENDSTLWLGTGHGILKVQNNAITHYFEEQKKHLYKVNQLKIDSLGNKWLGTYASTIALFNDTIIKEIKLIEKTGDKKQLISSLCLQDSLVWIGTSEGLILYYNTRTKAFDTIHSPSDKNIFSLTFNSRTEKWICTTTGLFYKFNCHEWERIEGIDQAFGIYRKNNDYCAIGKNKSNKIVLLYNLDYTISLFSLNFARRKWVEMELEGEIEKLYEKLNDFCFSESGVFWLATNNGLLEYNPLTGISNAYTVNEFPQLKLKNIDFVAFQGKNKLWIATTNQQLCKITLPEKELIDDEGDE